ADLHRLRKKLLESALPFFQKLTAQKSDDPEVDAGRGRAYGRLANVRHTLGENETAALDSEAERAIFARLAADFPAVPAYRFRLAVSLKDGAYFLNHLGKRQEAEAAYRQGQDICEKLVADFPSVAEFRYSLANGHNNLGNLLDDLGKRDEAEALYRKAVAIGEKLANEIPTVPAY